MSNGKSTTVYLTQILYIFSYDKWASIFTRTKWYFVDLTALSYRLPQWGDFKEYNMSIFVYGLVVLANLAILRKWFGWLVYVECYILNFFYCCGRNFTIKPKVLRVPGMEN